MKTQTILITGCAGFIGSHLSENLLNQGHKIVGVDNFDPFYSRSIKNYNLELLKKFDNFTFHEFDLTNLSSFEVINEKVDAVIHLAAKAGVLPSLKQPQEYINHNILATNNVLNFMQEKSIKKLLFASSSSVYGNNKEIPFRETDPVNEPISPYAFTKRSCELMNYNYHKLYKIDILNLRFFTVYGPRQRPDLAIHKFFNLIKNDQPIQMYGDGSTARDYTFVNDTVGGILNALNYINEHEDVFEIVNLGNNSPVKLNELINSIYETIGKKPNIELHPMKPGDVDITYASIEKAKELFSYQPQTSLIEGLQKFKEWHDEFYKKN